MSINFPKVEEAVLARWREIEAFQTQLRLTENRERFTFYDGPPFGNAPLPYLRFAPGQIIPRRFVTDFIDTSNWYDVLLLASCE